MANATALTLTALAADSSTANPTADAFDTGTAAVTVPLDVNGESDDVFLRVVNAAAAALTVTVNAGDSPPAVRAGIGAFTSGNIAQNGVLLLGPFESARFIQDDGTLSVTFTPASGTIACSCQAFRLPTV